VEDLNDTKEDLRDARRARLNELVEERDLTFTVSFLDLSVLIRALDGMAKDLTTDLEERLQKMVEEQGRPAAVEMARFVKDTMESARTLRSQCVQLGDAVMEKIRAEGLAPNDNDRNEARKLLVSAKLLDS
jgi:hypothetical protein